MATVEKLGTALAAEIREEYELANSLARDAVVHAIRCGEKLIEAKAALAHGEWLPWLEEHWPASAKTATNYMRLAANKETVADLPVGDGLKLLAAKDAVDRAPRAPRAPKVEIMDAEVVEPGESAQNGSVDSLEAVSAVFEAPEEVSAAAVVETPTEASVESVEDFFDADDVVAEPDELEADFFGEDNPADSEWIAIENKFRQVIALLIDARTLDEDGAIEKREEALTVCGDAMNQLDQAIEASTEPA